MRRDRSARDSFPDLNQESSPNNASFDHSDSLDIIASSVQNRLGEHDENLARPSRVCEQGESSYAPNNLLQAFRNYSDMLGRSSSSNETYPGSEYWSFEPSNISDTSYGGNQANNSSLSTQNITSNCPSLNINSNDVNMREDDFHRGIRARLSHTPQKPGDSEMDHGSSSSFRTSFGDAGNSSRNSDWGLFCKREALEGSSGQFYHGGSSSADQTTDNIMQHPVTGCYTSSENLTMSPTNHLEQINSRSGAGPSRTAPSFFPLSSGPTISEGSSRNFTLGPNVEHHDWIPFEPPRGSSARHNGIYESRPDPSADSLEMRSAMNLPMNPNNTLQPHLMHVDEMMESHPYPWNGSINSRVNSSSSRSSERGPRVRQEVHVRNSYRNNNNNNNSNNINNRNNNNNNDLEYPVNVSASGTRDDQIDWSYAPGTSASSRSHSYVSRAGPSSSARASSSSAWLPHQNGPSQNHHRLSEAAPWIYFPNIESDSGIRRAQFEIFPSSSSFSDEAAASSQSQSQHHLDQRSAADMPRDNLSSARAFAGRYRMIRQALTAMRRGERLQAEEYVLMDPFINGFAELHDRHRDLRLDVDNMSYEELLALGEQIGEVNTGLSEDKIKVSMKQRKYETSLEPCCICQENYVAGDDLGILDCGHEFHTDCIKKWLILKNLCPICKTTALKS